MPIAELDYRWTWSLPAPPEALWPLVADTNRFNQDTGVPEVSDARAPGEELENAKRKLRLSVLGVPVEWEEQPFEWVSPNLFGVARRYKRGPLLEMRIHVELVPEGSGTRLTYAVTALPRGAFGWVAAKVQIGVISKKSFSRAIRAYADSVAARARATGADDGGDSEAVSRGRAVSRRSMTTAEKLERAGVASDMAGVLASHLADADDLSLQRVRPYALADLWGRPRRATLDACLRATRAGLLDLRWDVLCPLCRGPKDNVPTLSALRAGQMHCDVCLADFTIDFERLVELTFRPNKGFRDVAEIQFCVGGPRTTPHIVVQQLVPAGEERAVSPALAPGSYRFRSIGIQGDASVRVAEDGAEAIELAIPHRGSGNADISSDGTARTQVAPTGVSTSTSARIRLVNRTDEERLLILERTEWFDDAVTAAEVTAMPEFRDLFSREVFAAGEFLSVGSLAVLFTDLKGSTRMYRTVGDAPAFGRVARHFEVLKESIAGESGVIVKTIGDAVMATFASPAGALRAVMHAQKGLSEIATEGEPPLVLKAGLHFGPCIAVTLNERLDYFGTTVNVAARLAGLSEGGDVVVTGSVLDSAGVGEALAALGVTPEGLEARLRGLEDEPLELFRILGPS